MANIALITADTTHAAYTRTKAAIEEQGHTVTGYVDATVTQATLEGYDLVAGVRIDSTKAASIASKLLAVNATVPLLLGTIEAGLTDASHTNTVITQMGLASSVLVGSSNNTYLVITSLEHPILANAFTATGTYNMTPGTGWASTINGTYIGDNLGYNSSVSNNVNHPALTAIPSNTPKLNGGATGRKIVVMSGIYGGSLEYGTSGKAVIRESINWALMSDNTDVDTTTTPATASAEMLDATIVGAITTIPAGVAEASASMPNHKVRTTGSHKLNAIDYGTLNNGSAQWPGNNILYNGAAADSGDTFIKFAPLPEGETVTSAILHLYVNQVFPNPTNIRPRISRVTQDWSQTVAPDMNEISTTNSVLSSMNTVYTDSTIQINITNLYKDIATTNNYGIHIKETLADRLIFAVGTYSGQQLPYMEVTTVSAQPVSVPVGPAAANATIVEPTILPGYGPIFSTTPATADTTMVYPVVLPGYGPIFSTTPATVSAEMLDVNVDTEIIPDYTFVAETFTVTGEIIEATTSFPAEFAAGAAEASGLVNDVTVETENSPIYKADPMTATSRIIDPLESAVTVEDDPLYQYLVNYTWGGSTWGSGGINQSGIYNDWYLYPFQERRDTDPIHVHTASGQFARPQEEEIGNIILGDVGLEGRWSARFDGTSYMTSNNGAQYDPDGPNDEVYTFMIKTTKKTQYIVGDDTYGIMLDGGRLRVSHALSFTDIADGKWHWVVVKAARRRNWYETVMEFWVDGWLDRRVGLGPGRLYGPADVYIDGKVVPQARNVPSGISGIGGNKLLASYLRFEGNLAYVSYFQDWNATDYDQKEMYYRAFGIVPVRAGTMEGSAEIQNARGKGNRPRALVVTFNYGPISEWASSGASRWDPVLIQRDRRFIEGKPYYYGEYLVEFQSAWGRDPRGFGSDYWRDERTYERRYINVMEDVDIQQYDLIMIEGYPDAGLAMSQQPGPDEFPWDEWDRQEAIDAKLTMLKHIREAQDTYGISFLITNPILAMDYGIISKYEEHTQAFRVGEVEYTPGPWDGGYPEADWRSAQIDPIRIIGTVPGRDTRTAQNREMQAGGANGERYFDTHRINKHRVVATVPDLTDIPSWIWVDYVHSYMANAMDGEGFSTKLVDRTDGMVIGDEFFINGTKSGAYHIRLTMIGERGTGTIPAIPPTAVMAGTVVTRENATHWTGTQEVPNPYKDYATSIVVFPGDRVAGTPIGGKVFVDITDTPNINNVKPGEGIGDAGGWVQEVPEDDTFEPAWSPTREWTYSSMRMTTSSTAARAAEGFRINPETGRLEFWIQDDPIVMFRFHQIYPMRGVPVWNLLRRGLHWLGIRDTVGLGGVRVRTQALESTSVMNDPTIYSEKGVVVNAQSAIGVSRIVPPAEADTPNADVYALPMYGSAEITGMSVTFAAGPMTATGEMLYDLEAMFRLGEEIMLYVTEINEITLFVLEDA